MNNVRGQPCAECGYSKAMHDFADALADYLTPQQRIPCKQWKEKK